MTEDDALRAKQIEALRQALDKLRTRPMTDEEWSEMLRQLKMLKP